MGINAQRGTDAILIAPSTSLHTQEKTARLDTRGASYASIRIAFASEVNTNATGPAISLLSNDTTVVSNFATITADRAAEDITAAKVVTYHVDRRASPKRYLRLVVTPGTGSTNNNASFAAISSLTRQKEAPSAASGMADAAVIV